MTTKLRDLKAETLKHMALSLDVRVRELQAAQSNIVDEIDRIVRFKEQIWERLDAIEGEKHAHQAT